jgi:hypothetical protein
MRKQPFTLNEKRWQNTNKLLEGEKESEIGLISLEKGKLANGTQKTLERGEAYLGPAQKVKGTCLIIPPSISQELQSEGTQHLELSDRNDAGFYYGNLQGDPIEIKYDENIPENENWHSHSSWEAYAVSNGQVEIGLSQDPDQNNIITETLEHSDYLAIGPYVQHKLLDKEQDPDLAIIRYGGNQPIAKFNSEGEQTYSWIEEPPEHQFRKPTYRNVKKGSTDE